MRGMLGMSACIRGPAARIGRMGWAVEGPKLSKYFQEPPPTPAPSTLTHSEGLGYGSGGTGVHQCPNPREAGICICDPLGLLGTTCLSQVCVQLANVGYVCVWLLEVSPPQVSKRQEEVVVSHPLAEVTWGSV